MVNFRRGILELNQSPQPSPTLTLTRIGTRANVTLPVATKASVKAIGLADPRPVSLACNVYSIEGAFYAANLIFQKQTHWHSTETAKKQSTPSMPQNAQAKAKNRIHQKRHKR
jgi:hypothetical protein